MSQVLNYRFRLMPTPAQANTLAGSMRLMGWGWNLMVRKTRRAMRLIHRGMVGTVQNRLVTAVAGKAFVGQRAAKLNQMIALGLDPAAAKQAVLQEMVAKARGYKKSRLAMELGMAETEATKRAQVGSANGTAWAQVAIKYRKAWEACWRGKGSAGAPRSQKIRDAAWLQCQIAAEPAGSFFKHAEPFGAFGENWVDLGKFFPEHLAKTPDRIKKGTAKSLEGLRGAERAVEIDRLKAEFAAIPAVRLLQHRPLPEGGVVKDMKVIRSSNGPDAEWSLVLALEVPDIVGTKVYPVTGKACGLNPARRHAVTVYGEDMAEPGVDGAEMGPGRPLARVKRKIRRLQRRLDRQQRANNPGCFDEKGRWIKGKRANVVSKRMQKTLTDLRQVQERASNQRKDAYHKIVESLLKRYDTVFLGDWKDEAPKVRRAKKKAQKGAEPRKKGVAALEKLGNRMDRDNALGVFRQILTEKVARSAGFKKLVIVPEPYTTQACAKCRALTGPKEMRVQGWWTCPDCGHKQMRGRTAAYNILQDGPGAELEQKSEQGPEGAAPAPKKSSVRGKAAGQAVKGAGDSVVGRARPQGSEGASASGPSRRVRKASTLGVSAPGLSAPARAKSVVTRKRRGMGEGASLTTMPGEAFGPTATTELAEVRGNRLH